MVVVVRPIALTSLLRREMVLVVLVVMLVVMLVLMVEMNTGGRVRNISLLPGDNSPAV